MKLRFRKYNHNVDFVRIRDFLVSNYENAYPYIWTFERWNYSFYFIKEIFKFTLAQWEKSIGIWENNQDEIVGFVCNEAIGRGEAFIQYLPGKLSTSAIEEMFDFIETNLYFDEDNTRIINLRILEGDSLIESIASRKGYVKNEKATETTSFIELSQELNIPDLPEDFFIRSMMDDNNITQRTLTFAKAFGNYGTVDEVLPHCYVELQKCSDYRKDLDVYIVNPDGEYISFCLIWYDSKNRIGILEPVGTNPDFRKKGLAKIAVYEAINRVKREGATHVYVGDGQQFYLSIGFKHLYRNVIWIKIIN